MDIRYDTATGIVMAGNTSKHSSSITKKVLAQLRDVCVEARSKSNQELILLLENFDGQVSLAAESLRSGEADNICGGWATSTKKAGKGKSKKNGDADENSSIASSNKVPPVQQPVKQPQNGSSDSKSGSAKANNSIESAARNQASAKSAAKTDSKSGRLNLETHHETPVQDVAAPSISEYLSDFQNLKSKLDATISADIRDIDFTFDYVRTALADRERALRSTLLQQKEDAERILQHRSQQARELTDRLIQANALSAADMDQYRRDVNAFTGDYKYDLHLVTAPRVHGVYDLPVWVEQLCKVSHVAPSYSYRPVPKGNAAEVPRPRPVEKQTAPQPVSSNPTPVTHNHQKKPAAAAAHQQPGHSARNRTASHRSEGHTDSHRHAADHVHENGAANNANVEKITIVPEGPVTAAPVHSLIISGGNLTPEELEMITKSLQLSFPAPSKPSGENGFSGTWTNTTLEGADQWANQQSEENNIRPVGDHLERSSASARPRGSGGPRGARGGRGQPNGRGAPRGAQNGRGGRGRS